MNTLIHMPSFTRLIIFNQCLYLNVITDDVQCVFGFSFAFPGDLNSKNTTIKINYLILNIIYPPEFVI